MAVSQRFHTNKVPRRAAAIGSSAHPMLLGGRAARPGRRKVGASDVFTALYTTIMATAVVADAGCKDQRRKYLDQRLDEARKDLARVLNESPTLDYSLMPQWATTGGGDAATAMPAEQAAANSQATTSRHGAVEAIKAICVPIAQLRSHKAETKQRDAYLTGLHAQMGLHRRWWMPLPAPDEGLDAVGAALVEEELASQETLLDGQREPQLAVHFAKMTEVTNRLVDELIEEAYFLAYPDDPEQRRLAMGQFESAWYGMRFLRNDGYPRFRLPSLDPAATVDERLALDQAARRIFQNWKEFATQKQRPKSPSFMSLALWRPPPSQLDLTKEIPVLVGKLCYNMLVSKAPPGIHNYNTLIWGFTSIGQHSLARLAADSLLLQTRLLPTQQTIVCLLRAARARGDMLGFYQILRRLVALDSRGMKIRRRAAPDVDQRSLHRHWAHSSDVSLALGYVVQRAAIDAPVLEAVFNGLLSLGQVRHAAVVYAAYLAESATVDAATLNLMINCVLDGVDIPAARALIKAFVERADLITGLLLGDGRQTRKLAVKIRLLLSVASTPAGALASKRPPGSAVVLYQPQEQADLAYSKALYDNGDADRLTSALFIVETQGYLARLAQIVKAAQAALAADVSAFGEAADAWAEQFEILADRPHKMHDQEVQYRRMAQLKVVEQTASTVFAACSYLMESFLDTVVEDKPAEPDPDSQFACLQSTSISSIFRAFLRRTSVPFGVRLATYSAATEAEAAVVAAANDNGNSARSATDAPERQVALLERHLTEDTPVVSALLENELKAAIVLALLPDDARNFRTRNMAFRQDVMRLTIDELLTQMKAFRSNPSTYLEDASAMPAAAVAPAPERASLPRPHREPHDAFQMYPARAILSGA